MVTHSYTNEAKYATYDKNRMIIYHPILPWFFLTNQECYEISKKFVKNNAQES